MKIFCTEYPLLSREEPAIKPDVRRIFLRGDSAINNSGKYLSRPWWCDSLSMVPLLVVRVGKVGRGFEPDRAGKYFSEAALGVGFADLDRFRTALEKGEDPSLSYNFDGCLFVSPFCPKEQLPSVSRFVTLSGEERQEGRLSLTVDEGLIGETLSVLSRYYLMKMGDLVTFPLMSAFEPVKEDFRRLYEGGSGEVLLDLGVRLFSGTFTGYQE